MTLLGVGCHSGRTNGAQPVLRVAVIPSTDPGKIVRESQPLVNYLERETGSRVELVVPTNYAAVVEAIANDRVDIAYLGGFTFVQASQRAGVRPIVQRERDQFNRRASDAGVLHAGSRYGSRGISQDPLYGGHDATAPAVANAKVDAGAMDELVYTTMMKTGRSRLRRSRSSTLPPRFLIMCGSHAKAWIKN